MCAIAHARCSSSSPAAIAAYNSGSRRHTAQARSNDFCAPATETASAARTSSAEYRSGASIRATVPPDSGAHSPTSRAAANRAAAD